MAVRSYLDQQIQNEAAARAAGAPVTRGSFTDIANREVGSGFVDRALGTIPANTPPPAPAFQQTFLSGLLAQLQSATPEQQQQVVSQFAPQIQGLLGPAFQQEDGRDPDPAQRGLEKIGRDYGEFYRTDATGAYLRDKESLLKEREFNQNIAPALAAGFAPIAAAYDQFGAKPSSELGKFLESLSPSGSQGPRRTIEEINKALADRELMGELGRKVQADASILKGGYLEPEGGLYGKDTYDHAIY